MGTFQRDRNEGQNVFRGRRPHLFQRPNFFTKNQTYHQTKATILRNVVTSHLEAQGLLHKMLTFESEDVFKADKGTPRVHLVKSVQAKTFASHTFPENESDT